MPKKTERRVRGGGGASRAIDRKGTRANKRTHEFQVVVEQDEAGFFVAECPSLEACYTQGRTYEEAIENIKDVIGLCLADLKARGAAIPRQAEIIGVKRVEVAA
ncbi:MAG TPA: type II toxin-antitoxin system HicB family antitoxin [Candidatus Methylomirabilis sp.]|nr:type II toxin-antitoxin system HicB family antitoxin [Candidatus Methylomirabilis sp.]